jgi:CBS domain-containing protein
MSQSNPHSTRESRRLPQLRHATVADAMHPGIMSCDGEATLTDVARMMSTNHVHCVLVEGTAEGASGEAPAWGIISDLDLLRAGLRANAPDAAGDLAVRPVSVETTTPLRDAAEIMLRERTGHAVVLHAETRLPVGVLSTLDVAGILAWGDK